MRFYFLISLNYVNSAFNNNLLIPSLNFGHYKLNFFQGDRVFNYGCKDDMCMVKKFRIM